MVQPLETQEASIEPLVAWVLGRIAAFLVRAPASPALSFCCSLSGLNSWPACTSQAAPAHSTSYCEVPIGGLLAQVQSFLLDYGRHQRQMCCARRAMLCCAVLSRTSAVHPGGHAPVEIEGSRHLSLFHVLSALAQKASLSDDERPRAFATRQCVPERGPTISMVCLCR